MSHRALLPLLALALLAPAASKPDLTRARGPTGNGAALNAPASNGSFSQGANLNAAGSQGANLNAPASNGSFSQGANLNAAGSQGAHLNAASAGSQSLSLSGVIVRDGRLVYVR